MASSLNGLSTSTAHFLLAVLLFAAPILPTQAPAQTVLDPRGVYGALAIRAPSEDEARAIASGDPSVEAGLNQIEVAEMRIAFWPKGRD